MILDIQLAQCDKCQNLPGDDVSILGQSREVLENAGHTIEYSTATRILTLVNWTLTHLSLLFWATFYGIHILAPLLLKLCPASFSH